MTTTIQNDFIWTGTGHLILRRNKIPPNSSDFGIRQDGDNTWVFHHYQSKSVVAKFTGSNATQALRALKVALVTARLGG